MDSSSTPNHDQPADKPAVPGLKPEASSPPPAAPVSPVAPSPRVEKARAGAETARAAVADDAPVEAPVTPLAWLAQNSVYLILIAAGIGWLYWKFGWEGLPSAFLTVVGVGFIIFIHELGHFLVAKWCDVHVITFSIGFGPALPGCSFKRGETTYKLSLLPLGGYVNMVGEGTEADENEDYPRSFKNKSVGQRMAIISAGVIMNVLLGFLCFLFVFRVHGENRTAATVWKLDPGSPAWQAAVQPGWEIVRIGDKENPDFEYLKETVMLAGRGEAIPFYFRDPDHPERGEIQVDLVPRREDGSLAPMIGVSSPAKLELGLSARLKRAYPRPVVGNSAAAAARSVDLKPGDVVLETTDPDHPDRIAPLKRDARAGTWDQQFARRLGQLSGKPLKLVVARSGSDNRETVEVPMEGFHYQDTIVGATDPVKAQGGSKGYDPFVTSTLPIDPRDPERKNGDPFEFRRRLRLLADRPVIVQVRRQRMAADAAPVNLLVPPAYHKRFGAHMEMGEVAAVRDGSPAARAEVRPKDVAGGQAGDVLGSVSMTDDKGNLLFLAEAPGEMLRAVPFLRLLNRPLDPVRLPSQLTAAAASRPGKKRVTLSVLRLDAVNHNKKLSALPPVDWDDRWSESGEGPVTLASPLSVPQLGLAYWVKSKVVSVDRDSPAAKAGLEDGDLLTEVRFRDAVKDDWGPWVKLESERGKEKLYDEWAQVFQAMQGADAPKMELKVRRSGDTTLTLTVDLDREDRDWPLASRGLLLMADQHLVKARNMLEALEFGYNKTVRFIRSMYLGLSRMFTGQVSVKTLGGPIEIVSATFGMARDDLFELIGFLGVLSINLAVVNFLPIPLLDGGHMVFLIYEKIRGKPASENVRAAAAYLGLALLLSLMAFVFYLDGHRRGWW